MPPLQFRYILSPWRRSRRARHPRAFLENGRWWKNSQICSRRWFIERMLIMHENIIHSSFHDLSEWQTAREWTEKLSREEEDSKQSHKNLVSVSAMLTRKFLQIRKVFATISLLAEEFPDTLQYKISRYYAKCSDGKESFQTSFKVTG